MRLPSSRNLIVIVVALSVLSVVVGQLQNHLALETARQIGYLIFAINIVTAIAGSFTSHRVAWAIYLVVSAGCMVAVGEATPLAAAWTLIVVLLHAVVQ